MAGYYFKNCTNCSVWDSRSNGFDVAVQADNCINFRVNGLSASNCEKGVQLNNCWDSDATNLKIELRERPGYFRKKLLPYLVHEFMHR